MTDTMTASIAEKLYPYQAAVIDQLVARRRQAIFDEPGVGKTIITLAALEREGLFTTDGRHILVLATKTGAALTWEREVETFVSSLYPHVVVVPAHSGSLPGRRRIVANACATEATVLVIANHAFIDWTKKDLNHPLWDVEWDAIIVDESHKVLPTKVEWESQYTRFWDGLRRLKFWPGGLRFALSGTPDRGKLENRYGTWKFLLPEHYNSALPYADWLRKNFHIKFKRIRVKTRNGYDYLEMPVADGLRNREEWNELEALMTIRRTKAEIAPWLPPKRYIPVMLKVPPGLKKAYEAYEDEFVKNDDGSTANAKAFWIRALQFAVCEWDIKQRQDGTTTAKAIVGGTSAKRDWILEWLDDRDYTDPTGSGKVIITSQLSEILRWLQIELGMAGFAADILDGSKSTAQRLAIQQRFQHGDLRIVLLNSSLGDSIDLDAADDMIQITETHDPEVATQTEDRAHRVSRNHNVFIWQLRSIGTVDEVIASVSDARFTETRLVYEGRRGVDFARKILARITP